MNRPAPLPRSEEACPLSDREIDAHQARVAHLTGICPTCGDAGWWIDDSGFHYCYCARGFEEHAKAAREDAEAEAEAEREAEQKRQRSIEEETPSRGYPISVSAGSNSAGRS